MLNRNSLLRPVQPDRVQRTAASKLGLFEQGQERQRVRGAGLGHGWRRTGERFPITATRLNLWNSESKLDGFVCPF
jgi:hypothetical protein